MRGLVALLILSALVISGCSSKTDTGGGGGGGTSTGPGGTGSKTGSATGGGTTSGGGGGGGSGTGTITVYLNRTTIDGPAPLKVNFTLAAKFKDGDGKVQKPTSSVTVAFRQTQNANGTAMTGAAQNGPTIGALPATFSLTFTSAGKYEVTATVKANGYKDGQGTVLILPRAAGSTGGGGIIFFDGGEGDASQWTVVSYVLVADGITGQYQPGCTQGQCAPYPAPCAPGGTSMCTWVTSGAEKKTGDKSWYSAYPDLYLGRMVTKDIPIPAGGVSHKLSFALKGGAEANAIDGLNVYLGEPGALQLVAGPIEDVTDWNVRGFGIPSNLNGKTIQVMFEFQSDSSCSGMTNIPGSGGVACGAGFDAGGYYVDDITVE